MIFRQATLGDLPEIMPMFDDAVTRMLREGKQQWNESYPALPHIMDDIKSAAGYVMTDSSGVVGYAAVIFTGEAAYESLVGEWITDGDYVVVHRIVVAQHCQGQGIARMMLEAVERLAAERGIGSFRIDTNFDNFPMLRLMEKCGFDYCGEITYEGGNRKAFEKLI